MRKLIVGVFPLVAMSWCLVASAEMTLVPLVVHTYSIVARDATSGQLGVAVQSHYFAAGTVVPWAEAGVGAIAVQAIPDSRYGKLGLELMRAGKRAPDALRSLLATDEARELRQVAIVDAWGGVSAHTGNRTIPAAGHLLGANFSVQANLMANDSVWPAMAKAFESAKGELAERLLAALDAAQQAGGDIRGKQSAAMVVVTGKPTGDASRDRLVDLRVDDNVDPLAELRRLLILKRAYDHVAAARTAQQNNENERALAEFRAASSLAPDNVEFVFWHGVALVRMGRVDEALPLFRSVFSTDKAWVELPARLARVGFLPNDPVILERITAAAK